MAKIEWAPKKEAWPDKSNLQDGITEWVRQRTGINNASFRYLSQMTLDDLILLAMAIGYKPPQRTEEILRANFQRLADEAERQRLKYEASNAVRYGKALELPDQT
jgi:hypothetical protein